MKRWSLPVALAVCIFLKFILFDIIWSSDTTFQSFSQPESYLIKGAIALLLAFPMVFFRSRWYAGIVCFLLDILLVANLMYWSTTRLGTPNIWLQAVGVTEKFMIFFSISKKST